MFTGAGLARSLEYFLALSDRNLATASDFAGHVQALNHFVAL